MSTDASTGRLGQPMRNVLGLLVVLLGLLAPLSAAQADDPAVEYVRRVARELIAANRSGSVQAFQDVINQHSHVQAIGSYALGSYRPHLKPADQGSYFTGMVRFISRYAASESSKYQVANVDFLGPAYRTSSGVMVDTRVHLKGGQSYDVQWLLQSSGGGYRIRDAKVQVLLGDYWMTPFLKDLFEKYIAENGSVQALVVALNR